MNKPENEKRNEIILAALFHDIGKLRQRANEKLNISETLQQCFCPVDSKGGYLIHKHAAHSYEFLSYFLKDKLHHLMDDGKIDEICNLAAKHHIPEDSTPEQWIIAEADRLSSGSDRRPKEGSDSADGREFRSIRLHSLFSEIKLDNEIPYKGFYRAVPFSPDNYFHPIAIKNDVWEKEGRNNKEYYSDCTEKEFREKLWIPFVEETRNIHFKDWNQFLILLKDKLERYTSFVPSSIVSYPFIPLYDHLVNTATIASAIFDYHNAKQTMYSEMISNRKEEKFILVGVDISGIQKFIFDFTVSNSKGVAKILRARSFIIFALTKAIINYLCHHADLSPFCVFSEAAGRFSMLVANIESIREKLQSAYKSIQAWMKKEYLGELNLVMDLSTIVAPADLHRNQFQKTWQRFQENIETAKKKKLSELLINEDNTWNEEMFSAMDQEGYNRFSSENDPVTGKLPKKYNEEYNERTLNQKKLGESLTKAEYCRFDINHVTSGKPAINLLENPCIAIYLDKNSDEGITYRLNAEEISYPTLYIANHIPRLSAEELPKLQELMKTEHDEDENPWEPGTAKTFSQIAYSSLNHVNEETWRGVPYLGIFKADVDNLGRIFSEGIKEISVSEYAALSRNVNFFYSAYLPHVIKKEFPNIYTVFAGGDDLFFVGDWRSIWEFAIKLDDLWTKHVVMNPNLSISAALVFAKSREPIRTLAHQADEWLGNKSKTGTKGKITICNETIKLERFKNLTEYAKELNQFAVPGEKEPILNIALIYRLFQFCRDYVEFIGEPSNISKGLYHSHMKYSLSRNIGRLDHLKNEEKRVNLEDCEKKTIQRKIKLLECLLHLFEQKDGKYTERRADHTEINWLMQCLHIPLTYVIFENRKKEV